jgi:gluconate 2-dehydrogenase gamma chain
MAPASQEDDVDRKSRSGSRTFSRRELLKRAGLAGAVTTAVPFGTFMQSAAKTVYPQSTQVSGVRREALETLTAAEADTLEAIVARLIPSDANGPGAAEARAAHYIDRALGGALASSRDVYRSGLASVDSYARRSKGAPFAMLSAADQDAVLRDVETNVATGFVPDASTFFNLVRAHTIQGTFCDPYYGGNTNFVGWDLIGYPGVRLAVTPDDQRLGARPAPTHRSAYDHAMFSRRRPARAQRVEGKDPWQLI